MSSPAAPNSPIIADEHLRLFVAGVTDYAIYMLSPEGIVSSWNAGAQRFKGYAPNEIIGQHFSRFYIEEDQARGLPAHALHCARVEGRFEDEGWRVRKDGSRFWANVVIDAIRDPQGELIGFAKITRDITERKRANDALHASEEQFRLLVQGVTDYAIYMLSPTGAITNWNSGARRIKGFEEHEVIGTHFSRFYVEEDVARGLPMHALEAAARLGRFESEGRRVRKDGTTFWAHVVIDPIKSELGELIGFAKVTRDITERREATAALAKAQEQLFQSQKLEAIGQLTGGVAHDFNNLLSVVVNGLAVLKRRIHDPDDVRVLDAIERAAGRGATLTQQLLTFARRQPHNPAKFNLNEVLLSFEAVLRRASTGSVSFELDLAPEVPLVLVDAPQVEAAILNLIVNARDATPDGGAITLRTESVDLSGAPGPLAAGRYVKVSVTDTGSGMTPEIASRAIDPFFTTKPVGKGTGLGLSQAYGLVQQAGGDLSIESTPGAGTTIALFFPALPDSANPKGPRSDRRDTALVVDDQADVLDMAVELFRSLGYEVLSADNGQDALTILKRTPDIDVLFSDVVMPGMSGIELGRQARLLAPAVKIILASGYAATAFKDEGADFDEFQFVSKPYALPQILKQLRLA